MKIFTNFLSNLRNIDLYFFFFSLIITNFLIIYNIIFVFLREIIVSWFILFVPGFLIWTLLKRKYELGWIDILFSLGISVSFLMIGGLILNYISLFFGYRQPLSTIPLLIFLDVIVAILLISNIFIRKVQKIVKIEGIKLGIKKFHTTHEIIEEKGEKNIYITIVFYLIVSSFPILSIIGTSSLNNNGSNILIMTNLIGIVFYIILLTLFNKKVHPSLYPYSIYMIGLTILFNISLRSWHIMGTDILTEYRMFQSTLQSSYWLNTLERHSYNACISITILPTMLERLTSIGSEYVFKIVMQTIFAFVPVIIYLFTRRITGNILAFLAGILYVSFPIFVNSMSMHIRQEIAFLFFMLIIITLFTDFVSSWKRSILLVVFGFSMIISHYSTTYICLLLFTIWYVISFSLRFIAPKLGFPKDAFKRYLIPFWYLILLFVLSFIWYSLVVNISAHITNFGSKVLNNLSNTFSNDTRVDQTSFLNQFNVSYKETDKNILLDTYFKEASVMNSKEKKLFYHPSLYENYNPTLSSDLILPLNIGINYFSHVIIITEIIKILFKLLMFVGLIYLGYTYLKKIYKKDNEISLYEKDYLLLSIASLTLVTLFTILPYVTIEYDLLRTTQQILGILVGAVVIGASTVSLKFLKKEIRIFLSAIFVVCYFMIYTHVVYHLIGGTPPSIQLNNYGVSSERFLISDMEIKSAKWLEKNKISYELTHADSDSISRIIMVTRSKQISTNSSIIPNHLFINSYLYLNKFNIEKNITYKKFQGEYLRFTIPIWFYDDNKNVIYNNGSSRIYH